jgi:hypothetical protein
MKLSIIAILFFAHYILCFSFQKKLANDKISINPADILKLASIVRNIDGSNNNLKNPTWGKSHTNLIRKTKPYY